MKSCDIYKASNCYIVVCMHKTDAGFWIDSQPIVQVPISHPPGFLGGKVMEVLSVSQENIRFDSSKAGNGPLLLKLAGCKSYKQLRDKTEMCEARLSETEFCLTPYLKGEHGEMIPNTEMKLKCSYDAESIENAVQSVFA